MRFKELYIVGVSAAVLVVSCDYNPSRTHGAIKLGDSTTIVTEKDSQYLKDLVTDFKPNIPEETPTTDTTHTTSPDTTKKPDPPTTDKSVDATNEKGLTVAFNEATIFIPNIVTKSYRNQDPKKGNGVSYQLISGNVNNNQVKIISGNVTRVWQHYQTVVILKNSMGTLQLDALSNTTEWEELSGIKNTYTITGLDAKKLEHSDANNAEIRKAVERAVRAHRISRRKQAAWLNSVHHVRSVTQAPLRVVLRSVIWKIEGKDATGKAYQKQLRVDIP